MRSLCLAATLLTAMTVTWIVEAESAAPPSAADAASDTSTAEAPPSNFQPYIFWAFGLSCGILLGFSLWTIAESRALHRKVDYLTERFRRAHPGLLSEDGPGS